jgi:hypothetical protein
VEPCCRVKDRLHQPESSSSFSNNFISFHWRTCRPTNVCPRCLCFRIGIRMIFYTEEKGLITLRKVIYRIFSLLVYINNHMLRVFRVHCIYNY